MTLLLALFKRLHTHIFSDSNRLTGNDETPAIVSTIKEGNSKQKQAKQRQDEMVKKLLQDLQNSKSHPKRTALLHYGVEQYGAI